MSANGTHRYTLVAHHDGGTVSRQHYATYEEAEAVALTRGTGDILPNAYGEYEEEAHGLSSFVTVEGNVFGVILHTVKRDGRWESYCKRAW